MLISEVTGDYPANDIHGLVACKPTGEMYCTESIKVSLQIIPQV